MGFHLESESQYAAAAFAEFAGTYVLTFGLLTLMGRDPAKH